MKEHRETERESRENERHRGKVSLLYKVKGKIMWAARALWLHYFKQTHTESET